MKLTSPGELGAPSTGKGKGRASDYEDSNVIRDPAKGCVVKSLGSFVSVLQTFKNIAPIMDGIVVDMDGSGEVCASDS